MANARLTQSQKVASITSSSKTTSTSSSTFVNTVTADDIYKEISTNVSNPLNAVEQPSYHWKLYLGSDIGTSTSPIVTIAETGKTSLNITNVEIDSTVAPNFKYKNMGATTFTLTISEPLNLSFTDKLLAASVYAGIKNFMKAPYFLQLDFLGYDPTTGAITKPTDEQWVWKILIQKIDSALNSSGSVHTVTAISFNDSGAYDEHAMIQFPFNINTIGTESTVGDVLTKLADATNATMKKSFDANKGVVPFKIQIKDKPYDNPINVASPFKHKIIRDQKFLDSSRNQEAAQLAIGNDIGKIIDYLMSVSETATKMINPADSATEDNTESKEYSTLHRVECEVTYDSYDDTIQDYIKTITYWVIGQDSVRPIVSAKSADDALDAGKKKLKFLKSRNYIKKEYQYLFTGINTEVIDFDIKLQFDFKTATNVMKGLIYNEVASPGIQYAPAEYAINESNTNWPAIGSGTEPIAKTVVSAVSNAVASIYQSLSNAISGALDVDVDNLQLVSLVPPMSFRQVNDSPSINNSVSSTNLRSRSIYGMMLNQLYGSYDANLGSVDLIIRGDPYWLGVTNTQSITEPSSDTRPNYLLGEHVFLLKFFLPQGIDDEGNPILTVTDTYSGFYAVQQVISKFEGGKFTQTLVANRMPTMQYTKLLSGN
jgi:hypothetical protein